MLDVEYVHESAYKHNQGFGKFLRGSCCLTNRWLKCIIGMIEKKCGQEASKAFPYLLHYSGIGLYCDPKGFNPNNPQQCPSNDINSPPSFQNGQPKGLNSASFVSHYFSLTCPNVGYGYDNLDNLIL